MLTNCPTLLPSTHTSTCMRVHPTTPPGQHSQITQTQLTPGRWNRCLTHSSQLGQINIPQREPSGQKPSKENRPGRMDSQLPLGSCLEQVGGLRVGTWAGPYLYPSSGLLMKPGQRKTTARWPPTEEEVPSGSFSQTRCGNSQVAGGSVVTTLGSSPSPGRSFQSPTHPFPRTFHCAFSPCAQLSKLLNCLSYLALQPRLPSTAP